MNPESPSTALSLAKRWSSTALQRKKRKSELTSVDSQRT
ncbi:hypothetical protein ANCDUO_15697 [Ancylostoma duodenale]|uniref:Uncharacterized protein n=1 Tax=Ancylostoma duodenale TaxID=51022 RepID=A0A0C2G5I2_9BILA|nr:hypothetical protein ANCDUO_15697 [Ancylostoma duodenale]